jgi:purine-binding chemotaxis protein CheW
LPTETPTPVEPVPTPEIPAARRACVVLLGGRLFAVDAADAREVVVLDTAVPVPGAPPSVLGLTNVRGTIVPVVDARPVLGVAAHTRSDRALVVAAGEWCAAVVIERVVGLASLDAADVSPAPADGLTSGEVLAETGDHARLLDVPALLTAIRCAWVSASGG